MDSFRWRVNLICCAEKPVPHAGKAFPAWREKLFRLINECIILIHRHMRETLKNRVFASVRHIRRLWSVLAELRSYANGNLCNIPLHCE